MPKISVITPCFNDGIYLDDAHASIHLEKFSHIFEHIIVDDGSDDPFTLTKLEELKGKGITVLRQEHKGLPSARNLGVQHAAGDYILPLDSDNKIIPEVFLEALSLMENDRSLDVVHTYAIYFGAKEGLWEVPEFSLRLMFFENHIDACALVRKSTLEKVGGYSADMVWGHEDWELWIKIGLNGKFKLLKKPGFHYMVRPNSMVHTTASPNVDKTFAYLLNKHGKPLLEEYRSMYHESNLRSNLIEFYENKLSNEKKNRLKLFGKLLLGRPL